MKRTRWVRTGGVAALSVVILGLLVSGAGAVRADGRAGLQQRALRMVEQADRLGGDEVLLKEALDLVADFEREEGPLFLSAKTKNGFPRAPKRGLELEQAMFALQQGILDYAFTPASLTRNRKLLDGAKFETAAYFPGAAEPPADPKKIYTVKVNASQLPMSGSPVAYQSDPARRPTGCYLSPGCVAEVAVPASLAGKGYAVRVGAHSWDLSKKKTVKRLDRVSLVFPITGNRTLIANPLGGGIYIEVPYGADAGVVNIQLRNVVRSPFYSARSFDRTASNAWKQERKLEAPWADFESDKFMMQVPSAWIRTLDDPERLMADWDRALDAVSDLFGQPRLRSKTVLYIQSDVMLRGSANFPGYPQSNFPYNPHKPEQCRHPWMIRGPQYSGWTVFHELGHAMLFSKFRGETEAVVNLPYVAVMNRAFGVSLDEAFGGAVSNMKLLTFDDVAAMWMVTENFRAGNEMDHSNRPGDEMKYQHRGFAKYVEIANLFGWEALGRFWKGEVENWKPGDKVPQNNDPVDDRILRLSKAAGADLTPLIHFWGIQPQHPEALARAMRKEGLKPSQKIRERLEHYRSIIPMNNAQFREHTRRVYPGGLKNAKNPLYGPGWYKAQLPLYGEEEGRAAQAALQTIIDRYFGEGK